jgi:hypothetical protein
MIVAVGGGEGVAPPSIVALEDFQLHGMRCAASSIELFGWDKKYTVDIVDRARPRVAIEATSPGQVPRDSLVESFDLPRQSRDVQIPSGRTDRRYTLHIAYRFERLAEGGIRHSATATLVETDASGSLRSTIPIHETTSLETVD